MNQHDFDKLLEKYLAGLCTEEEEIFIHQWSERLLQNSDFQMNTFEKKRFEQKLWQRIQRTLFPRQPYKIYALWTSLAGVACLLVVLFTFLWQSPSTGILPTNAQEISNASGEIEVRNTSAKPQQIKLEDGSLIVLKPQSSISYPAHFNDKNRAVYLQGEAFFQVKRNPSKPFIVHTKDLVTEVLGTSFNIKSYEQSKAIEVSVVTGRVSVYENSIKNEKRKNGVILSPNQKILFDKETKKLVPSLVENPIVINTPVTTLDFVFEETPLALVLSRLQSAYQIEFVIENHQLAKCAFTADLNELPLHKQLDLICKALDATYEQRGTVIFINGTGCQ